MGNKLNQCRIVYVGPLGYGQTSLHRMNAFSDIGHKLIPVNTIPIEVDSFKRKLMVEFKSRVLGQSDWARVNEQIIKSVKDARPHILWVDKGLVVKPETIVMSKEVCPGILAVSYSPDDMMNPGNQSFEYLGCIPLYDLHVTTKSYNVQELKDLGARDVLFVDNAYCPSVHHPMNVIGKEKEKLGGEVGFIGSQENEREASLIFLAQNGIDIRIWGQWKKKLIKRHPHLHIMGESLWGDEYAKAISAFDINFCFLRKVNRDLQTTRSVEIPACAAFMIAERTDEHSRLFKEGIEAEFFDSNEELLSKTRYYLKHDEERKRIAAAGYQRCIKSGYSNQQRMQEVLNYLGKNHFTIKE